MAKKILTPNLKAADTRFKRKTYDDTVGNTGLAEDGKKVATDGDNLPLAGKNEEEQAKSDEKPSHTMEQGRVVVVQERVLAKAGRPRARIYNNKGTKATTFNIPVDTKELIENCAFFAKVEQADIIRTALKYFLDNHTVANSLTPDGERMVRDYIRETSVK